MKKIQLTRVTTQYAEDDIRIKDPLVLNEWIFSLSGSWPLQHADVLLRTTVVYFILHLIFGYWDLYDCRGDVDLIVINILETMVATSSYLGLLLIATHRKELGEVIVTMKREIAGEKLFENSDEKLLYSAYNTICYRFGKYTAMASFFIIATMYPRPLIDLLTSSNRGNDTVLFQLPFRAHVMFNYQKPPLYALLYLYQLPVTYIPMFHVAEVSFIVNVMLHLCAKISILAYRIRNIPMNPPKSFKDGIKRSVTAHLELLRMSRTLNDCFHLVLLLELMSCGFRLGLALYVALISKKLGNAFYDIDWPEMASNERKAVLMCMMNGQKAMHITAGKFYVFSLLGFTEIVKTSMASLSMLRARM
ncbi:uncharacterized protein LOC122404765 [Colletes gigas]|uniref:uncharacterized protein LOC122404765 n=1 Tax=Colletes gigas TaxID=935657 RepID=UPI001C9B3DBB|nr:uncharacterized protein LOC122404765 [Colletes gigas]